MFDQIHRSKLLFWSLEILIVATLIWVCTKIDFLFSPIATFFLTRSSCQFYWRECCFTC